MSEKETQLASAVHDEVTRWFFDDYLATWVGVGARTIARGPEFILDYWGVPLHYSSDEEREWFLDAPAVVAFLEQLQTRLRRQGYAYTAVPDRRVHVYHDAGAVIEVIWSRRRADHTEIERLAAHFEVARGPAGWRMVGIQAAPTAADALDAAWARRADQGAVASLSNSDRIFTTSKCHTLTGELS
jgi:hypothetical protein